MTITTSREQTRAVADWIEEQARELKVSLRVYPENTQQNGDWVHMPVAVLTDDNAYAQAALLQRIEDTWNDAPPIAGIQLLLTPAKQDDLTTDDEGIFRSALLGKRYVLEYMKPESSLIKFEAIPASYNKQPVFADVRNGEIVASALFTGIKITPPPETYAVACQYRTLSGPSLYRLLAKVSDEPIESFFIPGQPGSSNQIAVGLVVFGHKASSPADALSPAAN